MKKRRHAQCVQCGESILRHPHTGEWLHTWPPSHGPVPMKQQMELNGKVK